MDKILDKMISFISIHKGLYLSFGIILTIVGTILGGMSSGWFLLFPVLVAGLSLAVINKALGQSTGSAGDNHYREIKKSLIDGLMPEFERIMIERGYSRSDYKTEVHDCDDYSIAGVGVLHELLEKERKAGNIADNNEAYPIFQYSFERDDGKRHRLFFVSTDKGRIYVDSWRINGSMYRKLSAKEEANGTIIF